MGGDSVESSIGCSLPPNQNCKRTENRIKSVKPIFTVRPSLKPTLSFPPCLGHCPKNPQNDSTDEDILKPVRLFRCKKRILQAVSYAPDNLCKFACGKLGADRGQIYVRKTNSSCPPRPLESRIGSAEMGLYPNVFMRDLLQGKSRVGGDSIKSFKVISMPPNQNCKRTANQIMSVKPIFTVRRERENEIKSVRPSLPVRTSRLVKSVCQQKQIFQWLKKKKRLFDDLTNKFDPFTCGCFQSRKRKNLRYRVASSTLIRHFRFYR